MITVGKIVIRALMSGNKKAIANINNNCVEYQDIHELLGITSDPKLTFENHINPLNSKVAII